MTLAVDREQPLTALNVAARWPPLALCYLRVHFVNAKDGSVRDRSRPVARRFRALSRARAPFVLRIAPAR